MDELTILSEYQPREVLQQLTEKRTPAIMSYLAGSKWQVAKVLLTGLGAEGLSIEPQRGGKRRPIDIRIDQPVGVSIKYKYGKFVFDTRVVYLQCCPDSKKSSGGQLEKPLELMVLAVPERIEIIQRRSYFRVNVPEVLKVNVLLWHRKAGCSVNGPPEVAGQRRDTSGETATYRQGRLVDISAGGAQVVLEAEQAAYFKTGQFVGIMFTPLPYEMPLRFNAKIRDILPTADGGSFCLGMQFVGLEASCEGRAGLHRLCDIVQRYHQINQSGVMQWETQKSGKHSFNL